MPVTATAIIGIRVYADLSYGLATGASGTLAGPGNTALEARMFKVPGTGIYIGAQVTTTPGSAILVCQKDGTSISVAEVKGLVATLYLGVVRA